MTGLEKLYNIVLKEQNVLNHSIYAYRFILTNDMLGTKK